MTATYVSKVRKCGCIKTLFLDIEWQVCEVKSHPLSATEYVEISATPAMGGSNHPSAFIPKKEARRANRQACNLAPSSGLYFAITMKVFHTTL
jgi:hypothetical protein